jgi:hypothetical protein
MKLRKGDIVANIQCLGKIIWIEEEHAGLEHFCIDFGFKPILGGSTMLVSELTFLHRPFDCNSKQRLFSFYHELWYEDEKNSRIKMMDHIDNIDRMRGVSEELLMRPKKSVEKKIEDKIKGMNVEDILKLLED